MSHLTGIMVVDAPASALNNSKRDEQARAENTVPVKFIKAPEGRYPYVSAQAVRYWLRTQLASRPGWTASPVFRETKVAYTDAEPTRYAEDDLFGYMREASTSGDAKQVAKRAEIAERSTPVDKEAGGVTRISPFRIGTLVSTTPVQIVQDFGTMARAEGDPVPHEHQFYRAHLKAPFAIDLSCAGTFFASRRVGYRNLDGKRIESAKAAGAAQVRLRGFEAWRLPLPARTERVAMLVRELGRLEGGAKQTLHLTDTAPSVVVLAVCKGGSQPFFRLLTEGDLKTTVFRQDVLEEALAVFGGELESDVFIGWAKGFLDTERWKLEGFVQERGAETLPRLRISHPREAVDALAEQLGKPENGRWFE
jgi:CRISPR-associated protein Cst2